MDASSENEEIETDVYDHYAVYIFNQDKYFSSAPYTGSSHRLNPTSSDDSCSKSSDTEELSGCLSLLEANLEAEQETIVRCHILKNLPVIENAGFQNEGKYVTLKYSSDTNQSFGCYYHHLRRDFCETDESKQENCPSRKVSFFICLIGNGDKGMESFCSELGDFCCSFSHYLDPEGHQCQKGLLIKLQQWHFHCVEYISRCIEKFKESLVVLFQASLWSKVSIDCDDESVKADLKRFSEACSLNALFLPDEAQSTDGAKAELVVDKEDVVPSVITLKVVDGKIVNEKKLGHYAYCNKWVDRLLSCKATDYVLLKNILEGFHLKIVQDLNLFKRILKKAENNYYALYRAYQFLANSGYEDALIHHVRREAILASNEETLRLTKCLDDFIKEKKLEVKQQQQQQKSKK